ncbi:MAG: TatD family hydrolase [Muribaculaceae bacterium]
MLIYDCHTHKANSTGTAIVNVRHFTAPLSSPGLYSAGIHPWDIENSPEHLFERLESFIKSNSQVVAIGECGIDHLICTPIEVQMQYFEKHIILSEQLHKPLLVHCVRGWQEVMAMHKNIRPTQPWIMHGFRGKPSVVNNFVEEGIYLSYGEKFNALSAEITPLSLMLVETDESLLNIESIAASMASTLHIEVEQLAEATNSNFTKLFL